MIHRITIGILFCFACAGSGCASQNPRQASPQIERDENRAPTAADRRYAFQETYARGLLLADRGDFANALGDFEHALQVDPDSTAAMIAVGACHEAVGDPFEAIRYYRQALARNPLEADAYANLGTAYIKLYHRERNSTWRGMALSAWQQSLAINPDQSDIRGYLASAQQDSSHSPNPKP